MGSISPGQSYVRIIIAYSNNITTSFVIENKLKSWD